MIDANCMIGCYPFRRLPYDNVDALLAKMDNLGVESAAVSRMEAVFYKDVHVANEELFQIAAAHRDRFWPTAVINPVFPGWEDDFARCQDLGMVGVRLHPNYHGYSPAASEAVALVERAIEAKLPLVISVGVEDARHQHPLFNVPNVPTIELAMLINYLPQATYLIVGAVHRECLAIESALARPENVHYELSRVQGPVRDVDLLHQRVGASRLLYGSNLPIHVPEAAKLSIDTADIPHRDKDLIRHGNAQRLFSRRR
jgi:uncharacterized protein